MKRNPGAKREPQLQSCQYLALSYLRPCTKRRLRLERLLDHRVGRRAQSSRAQFHKACKLIKTGLPTKFLRDFQDLANNSWSPVSSNMQQMEIWLVILFLSRNKFHAKQILLHIWPNLMALLTVSTESALTEAGNSVLTASVFHGLVANFGFSACVLPVTRHSALTRRAQKFGACT